MTATLLRICNQAKQTLTSRDAGFYLGPAAKLAARAADVCFKTNVYPAVREICSDLNAFSITYTVDAVNEARRGARGEGFIHWLAALFFGASITEAGTIASGLGYGLSKAAEATAEFVDTAGDVVGFLWKAERVEEIANSDYVKGATDGQRTLAETRQKVDLVRYVIWTVSALCAIVFSYLSAVANPFAQIAGAIAEDYSVSLIVNGVRGLLGLIGFVIGLNLVGRAPVLDGNGAKTGAYQDIGDAKQAFGGQQARDAAKNNPDFNSIWDKLQRIVSDRKNFQALTKVYRAVSLAMENLSSAAGFTEVASGLGRFSGLLRDRLTVCKLASVPGCIGTGVKNVQKHFEVDPAKQYASYAYAANAWLTWGFAVLYDVCAVPTYIASKAGVQLSTNVEWFLKEATRHWCGLFQAGALILELGCNLESRPHEGAAGIGARTRFMNGATHLVDGKGMNEDNWRDTLYCVDRIAVILMTALTLYRWLCDVREKKFAAFGTWMLLLDATKAGAGLAKSLWEDRDDSGFIGQQAEAYLKAYGAQRRAA